MIQSFDLHIHTTDSDGAHSAAELLPMLREKGIRTFSITDHDNLDSIERVSALDLDGLRYVPGVELSCSLDGRKIHMLGYGLYGDLYEVRACCSGLRDARRERFLHLAEVLETRFGVRLDRDQVEAVAATERVPGKPHLANLMVQAGYARSVLEAFQRYLHNLQTEDYRINTVQAIQAIHRAGGKAVWAHPGELERDYGVAFGEVLRLLLDRGIDGLEVYNSIHSLSDCERYLAAAREHRLLISGGSDYHGERVKPHVHLGEIYTDSRKVQIPIEKITLLDAITE